MLFSRLLLPPFLRTRPLPVLRRPFATTSPLCASRTPLYATESEARLLLKRHMKGPSFARKELVEQIKARGRAGTKSVRNATGIAGPLIALEGNLHAKGGGRVEKGEEKERVAKVLRKDRNSAAHVSGKKQSKPFWRAGSLSRKARAMQKADEGADA